MPGDLVLAGVVGRTVKSVCSGLFAIISAPQHQFVAKIHAARVVAGTKNLEDTDGPSTRGKHHRCWRTQRSAERSNEFHQVLSFLCIFYSIHEPDHPIRR